MRDVPTIPDDLAARARTLLAALVDRPWRVALGLQRTGEGGRSRPWILRVYDGDHVSGVLGDRLNPIRYASVEEALAALLPRVRRVVETELASRDREAEDLRLRLGRVSALAARLRAAIEEDARA